MMNFTKLPDNIEIIYIIVQYIIIVFKKFFHLFQVEVRHGHDLSRDEYRTEQNAPRFQYNSCHGCRCVGLSFCMQLRKQNLVMISKTLFYSVK